MRIEREHRYRLNGIGKPVAYQAKYILPDNSRSFVLQKINPDGSRERGLNGVPGKNLVIGAVRSRELMKTKPGYVFITEGPKDCEAILKLGFPCIAGYATSIAPAFGSHVYPFLSVLTCLALNSHVYCIGDGDEAGRSYSERMAMACWLSFNEWMDRPDIEVYWSFCEGDDGVDVSDEFDGIDEKERRHVLSRLIESSTRVRYDDYRKVRDARARHVHKRRTFASSRKVSSGKNPDMDWSDLVRWCRSFAVSASMEDSSQVRKTDPAGEVSGPCPLCGGSNRFWVNERGPWCRKCCNNASDKHNRKRFIRELFRVARGA